MKCQPRQEQGICSSNPHCNHSLLGSVSPTPWWMHAQTGTVCMRLQRKKWSMSLRGSIGIPSGLPGPGRCQLGRPRSHLGR